MASLDENRLEFVLEPADTDNLVVQRVMKRRQPRLRSHVVRERCARIDETATIVAPCGDERRDGKNAVKV